MLTRNNQFFCGLPALLLLAILTGCTPTGGNFIKQNKILPGEDTAMIHAQLARGYLQSKQYATAKEELESALRINPRHSHSNYVMALLMLELKQYSESEMYFANAVRFDRENSSAAHDFGVFLCKINKKHKAIEYFDIAISNPLFNNVELSFMRAGECLSNSNPKRAESYLKRALAINPQLLPALFRLAKLKHEQRQDFLARAYIERYMAITKPQPAALLLAYKIEIKLNAMAVAQEYRRRLLEGFPGSEEAKQMRRVYRQ